MIQLKDLRLERYPESLELGRIHSYHTTSSECYLFGGRSDESEGKLDEVQGSEADRNISCAIAEG